MTTRLPDAMFNTRLFCAGLVVARHTVISPATSALVVVSRARPSAVKLIFSRSVLIFMGSFTANTRSCCSPPAPSLPITTQ